MLEDLLQRRPYNAVTDLIDAPVERGLAGKSAFIDADRTLTYGELQARSCRFAAALLDIGLRPEERLALLLLEPTRQKPAHLCRRMDLHWRQIFPRQRRLLSLLRPH